MIKAEIFPSEWDLTKIEDIADVKGGKRLPKGESLQEKTTKHPYIRVADMYMGGVDLQNILFVPDHVFPSIKRYTISKKDLFISVAGTLGIVGKIPNELDGANLTENADKLTNIKINKDYLLQVLLSPIVQNAIEREQTNNAQPKLALSRIRGFEIPNPPLPEQQKIADILSTVDAKIDIIQQQIDETQDLKKGLMQRLLTKGIGHTEFKDSHLGEIPKSWKVVKQSEVATFYNGRAYKLSEWEDKGTPVIRLQNLTGSGKEFYYSNLKLPEHQYCSTGDLLYMWSATFGPVWWQGEKAIYHYHIWKITHSNNLLKTFHYYLLDDVTRRMKNESHGSTMLHVTKGGMEKLLIQLPPLEEQQKIAEILSTVDDKLEVLEEKKTSFQDLKKGLMQQLLTGKVRVKVANITVK
ncbi:restriction endonuclease subunit S [Mangrovimonas xylaniphaga]|uniref:restriction endonuclease subunit S n=1 Tax=Mangrovimonas xylaniphaga TaxID=1645915 RepID=UPI0006B40B03|nr:restriction endonuclease subunit S [Mangrovimonas xylaniphaga]